MQKYAKALIKRYGEDNLTARAAALSYFAIFSLGPLLFIILGILGLLGGNDLYRERLLQEVEVMTGPQASEAVSKLISSQYLNEKAGFAILLGAGGLLLAAIGVFGQLQRSLNDIFRVKVGPAAGKKAIIVQKIVAVSLLLFLILLLIASVVSSILLSALDNVFADRYTHFLLTLLDFAVSIIIVGVMAAIIYRRLPDVRLPWKPLLVSGFVVAFLFWLGTFMLGMIIGGNATVSALGAAGSVVALMIWMYYSGLVFYLGATGISIYANDKSIKMTPRYGGEGGVLKLIHKQEPLTPGLVKKIKKNFKEGVKKGSKIK